MQELALIKLGGSVITFKERALAANEDAISKISSTLAKISIPMIIVHGGGSFGHYWSVRYDMHTRPSDYDPQGVAIVHESMIRLNQIIINSMIQKGLPAYSVQPAVFTSSRKPIASRIREIFTMAKKIIPVTFGDVVHTDGSKFSILSGDALMTIIAKALKPSKVIFATNVDGLYRDVRSRELIDQVGFEKAKTGVAEPTVSFSVVKGMDVTGGMHRKVLESKNIASLGIDVVMLNGLEPERILDALEGRRVIGTVFRGAN